MPRIKDIQIITDLVIKIFNIMIILMTQKDLKIYKIEVDPPKIIRIINKNFSMIIDKLNNSLLFNILGHHQPNKI